MDQPNERAEWFLARGAYQHGPITSGEVMALAAAGHIEPTDLVWCVGMPEWTAAGRMDGLLDPVLVPVRHLRPAPPAPSHSVSRARAGLLASDMGRTQERGEHTRHHKHTDACEHTADRDHPVRNHAGGDDTRADHFGRDQLGHADDLRPARARESGVVWPLLLLGAAIGLGLGWINRPSVLFGMQLDLRDVLQLISSKAPLDQQLASAHLKVFAVYTFIGAALGATIGVILDRR